MRINRTADSAGRGELAKNVRPMRTNSRLRVQTFMPREERQPRLTPHAGARCAAQFRPKSEARKQSRADQSAGPVASCPGEAWGPSENEQHITAAGGNSADKGTPTSTQQEGSNGERGEQPSQSLGRRKSCATHLSTIVTPQTSIRDHCSIDPRQ
jgi:hypothetical protein